MNTVSTGYRLVGLASLLVLLSTAPQAAYSAELASVRSADNIRIVVASKASGSLRKTPDLLGFNMATVTFQRQFFEVDDHEVNAKVVQYLSALPGALYRYPGGLLANHFNWQWAVGPDDQRPGQGMVRWQHSTKMLFGPAEFVHFLNRVHGRPLIALNLVGWSHDNHFRRLDIAPVAANQGAFARYLQGQYTGHGWAHLYELGNELDRGGHQWSAKTYIHRAQAVMEAVRAKDPQATFIMPARGFNWRYRGRKAGLGVSRGIPYSKQMLAGLRDIDNVSMHIYYDPPWKANRMYLVPTAIARIQRVLSALENQSGRKLGLWVTEHARDWRPHTKRRMTSDLAAAVSTADFLTALMQVPEAKGACWHALNGGPWQVFNPHGAGGAPEPRPIYWAFRVLQKAQFGFVLPTTNYSTDRSGYAGGYDTRAVAFRGNSSTVLGVWAINRRRSEARAALRYANYAGCSGTLRHYFIAGSSGKNPDSPRLHPAVSLDGQPRKVSFDGEGQLNIVLPPSSVSSYVIKVTPGAGCNP